MDPLKTYQIFIEAAAQKQLRSAPWTEATFKCNDHKPPAGGWTAAKMRAEFQIYCSLDNGTYYIHTE